MQSLFGSSFAAPATINVDLLGVAGRPHETIVCDGQPPRSAQVYCSGEDISGDVKIAVQPGKKIEHIGIKAEIKGIAGAACRRWSIVCRVAVTHGASSVTRAAI